MRKDNFWKKAAGSLPEPYRSRYAGHFAQAARWDNAFDEIGAFVASVIRSTRSGRPASR